MNICIFNMYNTNTCISILLFSYICIIMLGIWWASPVNPKVDKQEICRYVHNIQSDTAEYAKLLQRLANHRIVLLGEQTHSDGGTFTYKERA